MPDLIPDNDHFITLDAAITMTDRYRDHRNSILASSAMNQNILPVCETFNRAAFDTILKNNKCAGVRLYYSMDSDLKIHIIVVGVDSEDNDILPEDSTDAESEANRLILERALRCPVMCPPDSPLNS